MTNAFSNQWQGLLESLLHRGSSAGADLVEVFLERTDHIGLIAEQDLSLIHISEPTRLR